MCGGFPTLSRSILFRYAFRRVTTPTCGQGAAMAAIYPNTPRNPDQPERTVEHGAAALGCGTMTRGLVPEPAAVRSGSSEFPGGVRLSPRCSRDLERDGYGCHGENSL